MSSHIDDPLADLLSDNSLDNEAFFDGNAPSGYGGQRRPHTAARLTQAPKSSRSKIEDLFGIQEEVAPTSAASSSKLKVPDAVAESAAAATSTPRRTKPHAGKDTDNAGDDDDDDLGFDPRKPKAVAKRDLFDDLLSPIAIDSGKKATAPSTLKAPISRQSTDTTTDNSHMPARPKTSSGRRSSGTSALANSADALAGLFGVAAANKQAAPSSSGLSTPMQTKRVAATATADWLGLGVGVGVAAAAEHDNAPSAPPKSLEVEEATTCGEPTVAVAKPESESAPLPLPMSGAAQNILLLNNMAVEANTSCAVLQQQEANLLMATQMGTHEKALLEIKQRQDAMMRQQERQLQALVQQQLQRQHHMEEHIKQQQQRINAHLQLLLVQPSTSSPPPPPPLHNYSEERNADHTSHTIVNESGSARDAVDVVELSANVKRLELERERLEELLANVRAHGDQELEAVRTSYQKQLQLLEEHLQIVEQRLRQHLEEQRLYFVRKVELLESDAAKAKDCHATIVANLRQEHEDDVRRMRKSHDAELEMVREEHRRMLDNVRQAKLLEFALVQENGSYLQTLRAASTNLETLSGGLQELRDELQLKMDTLHMEREAKLVARERRVDDAERRLKIGEEKSEAERTQLMALVAGLELQLNTITKERADEQWLVRQQLATLEAERSAFDKEKEYVREQLARDEQRLAELKQRQLAEHQRVAAELHDQQAKLSLERTKLETKLLLQPVADVPQQQAELEAAMEVARDAAKQADTERERCRQLQRQLEQARRQLVDDEHAVQAKRDELALALRTYQLAREQAQAERRQAKAEEQSAHTKMLLLAERARDLNARAARLSEERLEVRRERVALEQAKRKLHTRCALCHITTQTEQFERLSPSSIDPAMEAESTAACHAMAAEADDAANELNADERHEFMQQFVQSSDIVERLLDEHIDESFRRMRASTGGCDTNNHNNADARVCRL